MIVKLATLCYCIAAVLGSIYPVAYNVYPGQPQYGDDYLGEAGAVGYPGMREYDPHGMRHLQTAQAGHAARNYGAAESHGLRDFTQQAHSNRGIKAATHNSRGQEGHFRRAHDRGSYEREKKFGFEKAFGYERESKQNDKADHGQSFRSQFNQDELLGKYNHAGQSVRDLADHGRRQSHASQSQAHKSLLHDRRPNFAGDYMLGDLNPIHRPDPMLSYGPRPLHRDYLAGVGDPFGRTRYLSGTTGLGGPRRFGMAYDYNPLRQSYASVDGELGPRQLAELARSNANGFGPEI